MALLQALSARPLINKIGTALDKSEVVLPYVRPAPLRVEDRGRARPAGSTRRPAALLQDAFQLPPAGTGKAEFLQNSRLA